MRRTSVEIPTQQSSRKWWLAISWEIAHLHSPALASGASMRQVQVSAPLCSSSQRQINMRDVCLEVCVSFLI